MVNMAKFGRFSLVPAVGIDNDIFSMLYLVVNKCSSAQNFRLLRFYACLQGGYDEK